MTELIGVGILFVSAAALMLLVSRLPAPNETIYILTGIIIVQLTTIQDIFLLAEAGAVFVIFLTTMHLRTDAIRAVMLPAAVVTAVHAGVLLSLTAAGMFIGFSLHESVLMAALATFSSSMIGIDILENQVDRRLLPARLTEAINFGQDLIVVLLIGMLPFWPSTTASLTAGIGTGALLIAMLLFRRPVTDMIARLKRYEETTLLIGLTMLWAINAILSGFTYGAIIGAVAAGLLLATHPENLPLIETFGPVRDFFATLFFVSLGVLVATPLQVDYILVGVLVVLIAIMRPILTALVLIASGINVHSSVMSALQTDQPSEIVLLLGLAFHLSGLVSPAVGQAVIIAAAATFISSAYTSKHADQVYHSLIYPFTATGPEIHRNGHILIAGYGIRGKQLAQKIPDAVIIDNDPAAIRAASEDGHAALLGDIHDRVTWNRASLDTADLAVLTIPSDTVARRLHASGTDAVVITESSETASALQHRGIAFAADLTSLSRDELITQLESLLHENFNV